MYTHYTRIPAHDSSPFRTERIRIRGSTTTPGTTRAACGGKCGCFCVVMHPSLPPHRPYMHAQTHANKTLVLTCTITPPDHRPQQRAHGVQAPREPPPPAQRHRQRRQLAGTKVVAPFDQWVKHLLTFSYQLLQCSPGSSTASPSSTYVAIRCLMGVVLCVCVHACVCACMYVRLCVCVCVCVCVRARARKL
jgi:hypothetical protein